MKEFIIFHAKSTTPFRPCMDGLFAAYVARVARPKAQLVPGVYGSPPVLPISGGDQIYLIDLSYPAHILEGWADAGAKVTIIDHHKTALSDLAGLSDRVLQRFDMAQSGAVLSWKWFHPAEQVPTLLQYVQDRDLWQKQLPDSDLVSLGLSETMHKKTLDQCLDECWFFTDGGDPNEAIKQLIVIGQLANKEIQSAISNAVAKAKKRLVMGRLVPFFECSKQREFQACSDIGHALLKSNPNAPFVCVQTGGGWALRSADDREDVSAIAKMLGGGGHRNASGCRAELPSRWWTQRKNFEDS